MCMFESFLISFCRGWELTGPWTGSKVKVPTKFIVGDLDLTYTTRNMRYSNIVLVGVIIFSY